MKSRSADRPSENSCKKNSYAGTIADADNDRNNVWRYLQKLYTYMLALAEVGAEPLGNAPADKRGVNTPSQVICPLDVLLRYHSRAAHAVGKSTGADVKAWLIANDNAERTIWVDKMVNSDESLGQIIASTMKERAEAWRAPPQSTHL